MGFLSSITGAIGSVAKGVTSILNPISSVIGAAQPITSVIGSYYDQKQAYDTAIANANAIRDTNAANLSYLQSANAQNLQLQNDFAQKGISWRVQDAKNAGISPLAALGANVSAPSIGVMAHQDTVNPRPTKQANLGAAMLLSAQIKKEDAMANYYNSQAIATAKQASDHALNRQQITTPWGKFNTSATTKQQQMEDEYGGLIGEIYGVGRFGNDVIIEPLKNRKGTFYRNPRRLPDIDLGPMP